jgi:hypothetical protein
LSLLLAVAACSRPYETPVIAQSDTLDTPAYFDGLTDLMGRAAAQGKQLQVIWTHGMCTHTVSWSNDRTQRIEIALSASAGLSHTGEVPPVGPQYVRQPIQLVGTEGNAGALTAHFLIYSGMTDIYLPPLQSDTPGSNPVTNFPYTRAPLNNTLKTELMNDCLVDAVVYAGSNGDPIRFGMLAAICHELGGTASANQCKFDASAPTDPVVFVSESLGSKIMFDAIRTIWNNASSAGDATSLDALAQRLASVDTVFLMANQIPLLDAAGSSPTAVAAGAAAAPKRSAIADLVHTLNAARNHMHQRHPEVAALNPLTIVAFTDPNDLLSYRLHPAELGLTPAEATLVNVIVSNDDTYVWYLENPLNAHCGYAWNNAVIGMVAKGYHAEGKVPTTPPLPSNECL